MTASIIQRPARNSWLALVVADVKKAQLQSNEQGRLDISILPTHIVNLEVVDAKATAVLSWRWDTADDPVISAISPSFRTTSSNILCAVRYAKSVGIEYLFIDAISIDQNQSDECLIREVAAFTQLYKRLPVIAAYDSCGELGHDDIVDTMSRPWINFEIRQYRSNPHEVTYVGYQEKGGCFVYLDVETHKENKEGKTAFQETAEEIWRSGDDFTRSIVLLMSGKIRMTDVADLRYMMPSHGSILSAAYAKMSENDYLLTAALLCIIQSQNLDRSLSSFEFGDMALVDIAFKRYMLCWDSCWDDTSEGISSDTYSITLDDTKVASFIFTRSRDEKNHELSVLSSTEQIIHKALGLEDDYKNTLSHQCFTTRESFESNTLAPRTRPPVKAARYHDEGGVSLVYPSKLPDVPSHMSSAELVPGSSSTQSISAPGKPDTHQSTFPVTRDLDNGCQTSSQNSSSNPARPGFRSWVRRKYHLGAKRTRKPL